MLYPISEYRYFMLLGIERTEAIFCWELYMITALIWLGFVAKLQDITLRKVLANIGIGIGVFNVLMLLICDNQYSGKEYYFNIGLFVLSGIYAYQKIMKQ